MYPAWLDVVVATVFLAASAVSTLAVVVDIVALGHRQPMRIMELVWPVTALWAGPFGLHAYLRWGRVAERSPYEIAMFCGFATSDPVNWWLLERGVKEPM